MSISKRRMGALAWPLLALLLAACSGGTNAPPSPAPLAAGNQVAASAPASPPQGAAPGEGGARPAWQLVPLTDVRTGEQFTLAGLEGKVVIMETMAVWCPFCDQQQAQIKSALAQLGDGAVAVSLDVDPGEDAGIVAGHADRLDLPWRFALSGPELAAMLQQEYGPQVLAPPSTPVIIIGPDGKTVLTPFGIKGWDDLVRFAQLAAES